MTLAERRAVALEELSRREPPARQRYPGETQPSGDMPDNPWQADAYFAERHRLDALDDCEPDWTDNDPANHPTAPSPCSVADLGGQLGPQHWGRHITDIHHDGNYL